MCHAVQRPCHTMFYEVVSVQRRLTTTSRNDNTALKQLQVIYSAYRMMCMKGRQLPKRRSNETSENYEHLFLLANRILNGSSSSL